MKAKLLGGYGEAMAARYLRKKGYEILACNYRSAYGEIDLIAAKLLVVAFVEVKTRKNDDFAKALEHVTKSKQEKIKVTALLWISETGEKRQPRFDVMEVYAKKGIEEAVPEIRHIENAF